MTMDTPNHLWQRLWEYDPNGLIVVDADLYIKLVNPAFCTMFQVRQEDVIGQPVSVVLDDVSDFKKVWQQDSVIRGKLKEYPQHNLYVNEVIFAIADEGVIACIMVDLSHDLERKRELDKLKREAVRKVNEVVNKQMKVVQEIAGLLGETTAETKVSLWEIVQTFEKDSI
ncbi:MAG TPA: PAS domain-containing protein [Synechococcales cyanobacterium M55_K2018_004]|nr:PAS domain-containing protein [Synechococcales cyanobacterium M55_K2018_004]